MSKMSIFFKNQFLSNYCLTKSTIIGVLYKEFLHSLIPTIAYNKIDNCICSSISTAFYSPINYPEALSLSV